MTHKLYNQQQNICINPDVIKVSRPDDMIDMLSIQTTPNQILDDALRKLSFIHYVKKTNTYSFKIYKTPVVCQTIMMSGVNVDMSELIKWNNLVFSWNKSYKMIDLSRKRLKFTPYPFQIEDIRLMLKRHIMLNGNDMGCGKTFESVVVGESLPMKKIVICPATLRMNWEEEIHSVNPDADVLILYSDMPYQTGKDWTIIGYSSLDKFSSELVAEFFQCIFIDEAHFCQAISGTGNPNSARAKVVLKMAATAGYVYPITGTPKPTRNKDLFNILRILKHPLAERKDSFFSYGNNFCAGQQTKYGWNYDGNSNDDKLYRQLKPYMIRHLKNEVLPDLKKLRICIPVRINLKEYAASLDEYRNYLRANKSVAEQLRVLTRAKKSLAVNKCSNTIEFARDIIKNGEKVIIVTCFSEVVQKISEAFKGNVLKIVGGMTDAKKADAKKEFQEGKAQVLVMNIIAGGVGLTLTKAHYMIINDYDWTVGNIIQAEDRICRGGQTELCFIYFMTARGAKEEERFVDMLTHKAKTINRVINNGAEPIIDFRSMVNKCSQVQ